MQIPRKPVTGENLKKYVVDTFKAIIDYLHASKIRPGNGIDVRETPCGTVISLASRSVSAQSLTGGEATEVEGGYAISVSGGTGGNPYVVSLNIQAGSNISLSGGTNGNPLVISATGGGGGGSFYTPNYSALSVGGSVPQYGLGNTFVLPVKSGNVGFFDDGGGAVGVWTDISGTITHALENRVLYPATSDGWIRVSVIDGGTASGACLRIQDSSGSMPIYKYGSFRGGGSGSGLDAPDWRNIANGTTPNGNSVVELTKNGTATTTSTAGYIYAYAEFTYGAAYPAYASAHVVVNGGTFKVCSLAMTDYPNGDTPVRVGAGITIPVISGATVSFLVSTTDYNGNQDNSAFITNAGCVLYQNLS